MRYESRGTLGSPRPSAAERFTNPRWGAGDPEQPEQPEQPGQPGKRPEPGGETKHALARVIDFRNAGNNRFLAVRELKIQFFPLVAGPVTSQ